ncbi:MAG: hypothetical protein ACR2I5_00630 [Candidatus Limnocylindria bacterium]
MSPPVARPMNQAPPRSLNLRFLSLGVLWAINVVGLAVVAMVFLRGGVGADWVIFSEAGERVVSSGLYDAEPWGYNYIYSPLLAYAWIVPLPLWAWLALHVLPLLTLPRHLAVLTLVSFPFWLDLYNGGMMVFLFVAAWHALNGNRVGAGAFFALCLLAPRPPFLPAVLWLLWKRPAWRVPFVALVGVYGVAVLASGWGTEWVAALLSEPGYTGADRDFGPTRIIGYAWLIVGIPLAAWLTYRGRVGWAGLAVSPYITPQYAMVLLLEARPMLKSAGTRS